MYRFRLGLSEVWFRSKLDWIMFDLYLALCLDWIGLVYVKYSVMCGLNFRVIQKLSAIRIEIYIEYLLIFKTLFQQKWPISLSFLLSITILFIFFFKIYNYPWKFSIHQFINIHPQNFQYRINIFHHQKTQLTRASLTNYARIPPN